MDKSGKRGVTLALYNQFDSSYRMLTNLVDASQDEIWYEVKNGVPFWYQVFHITYFIDFWFRQTYDDQEFRCMIFDERIKPEFEEAIDPGISISRDQMKEYLQRLTKKIIEFFNELDDEKLGQPIVDGAENYTFTDVIIGQIRHIMYNIGYLNGMLREHGTPESDWYSYNEN